MVGKCYYDIMCVARTCDAETLKKAYKKQAMKWHPDRHANSSPAKKKEAEAKFKELAEVYDVLSDPNKREIYDRYGENGLKQGPSGPSGGAHGTDPFGGFGGGFGMPGNMSYSFSSSSSGTGGASFSSTGMDSDRAAAIFASLFGGGGGMGGGGMGGSGDPFADFGGSLFGDAHRARRQRTGPAPPQTPRPDGPLPAGQTVKVEGLQSSSALEHNGSVGTIDRFDMAAQRYHVSFSSGAALSVRPENVRQVITSARVIGCQNQPHLNGRVAASTTFDCKTKRYRAEGLSENGATLSLKPENMLLPESTQVTIDGLVSRPALNGKRGLIVGVEEERYVIQTSEEKLRLRFGTVVAA